MSTSTDRSIADLLHALEEARRAADELGRGDGRRPGTEALLEVLLDDVPSPAGLARGPVITAANRRLCRLLRLRLDELAGHNVRALYLSEEEHLRVGRTLYRDIQTRGVAEVETVWRRADGALIDVRISATGLRPEEEHGSLLFTVLDVSERRAAESGRRASENRFRSMFEFSPMGALLYSLEDDDRLVLVGANPAADRILGIDHAPLIGRTIEEAFPALAATEVPGRYRAACRDGSPWTTESIQYRDHRIDGAYEVHAFQVEEGMMVAFFLDVTERERTESALRESEERLRTLAENLPVGVYRAFPGRRLESVNPAMERMFGYPAEELLGMSLWQLYADPANRGRVLAALSARDHVAELELEMRRRDGSTFWATISARGVVDASGAVVSLDGIIADTTEQRLAAHRLAESVAQLRSTLEGTIRAMAVMVELRDPYTSGHQRRSALLAVELARTLGLDEDQVEAVRLAATIHDVGKIAVPAEILAKPGPLRPLEMELLRTHAESGYQILRAIPFPWPVAEIVREHHERWDGSGYPRGLAGASIRVEARVLSVADAVEAMSNHRPYRLARGVEQAVEELRRESGRQFDPEVVHACAALLADGRLAALIAD